MPGVNIGNGAIIGGRSVVSRDVPAYCIAVGNPATVIKKRFSDEIIKELQNLAWWNWSIEHIEKNMDLLVTGDIGKVKDYAIKNNL
jgi:virginiamycin A acetyltransferase